jgi:hypothetical protein
VVDTLGGYVHDAAGKQVFIGRISHDFCHA